MIEKPITSVTFADSIIDIGALVAKRMPSHCRYRYTLATVFTLEDGTTVNSFVTGTTKAKLKENQQDMIDYVASKSISAIFNDGKYWGTTVKMRIC